MNVHVSIHDVTKKNARQVERALELCAKYNCKPALLVVPFFHEKDDLLASKDYQVYLQSMQKHGHEIYLHGYSHLAHKRLEKFFSLNMNHVFRQKMVSNGEAEFASVGVHEAETKLEAGLKVFGEAMLKADGFIAPAWSFKPWLLPMLAKRDLFFTEDHFHIYDTGTKKRKKTLLLNWASRSAERIFSTTLFCKATYRAATLFPTRIAIHPSDMDVLLLVNQIERTLAYCQGRFVSKGLDLF